MTRNPERLIEAVIFDLDDTLIDWSQPALTWDEHTRPMVDSVYDYLQQEGHKLPSRDHFFKVMRECTQRVWNDALEAWTGASLDRALGLALTACDIAVEDVDMEQMMRAYTWRPMPGVECYDDAIDVLQALREQGYKIGLITNSFLPMWMRDVELRHYDLLDYFDARLTSGDSGYLKPHPAIYEHMLEMLEVDAESAVFVGDRPSHDIAGANEVGLVSVLIDPPHLERELDGTVPDFTITTLSELLPVLERLEAPPGVDGQGPAPVKTSSE
ncbi:MAG TPA: HAD family hydrolase [Candidatus Sulfomarinibacteraceae bacterium]|nr:HAD family hydrolase [Candidatus Sulfomarinibacteraceae bacterium]